MWVHDIKLGFSGAVAGTFLYPLSHLASLRLFYKHLHYTLRQPGGMNKAKTSRKIEGLEMTDTDRRKAEEA